MMLEDTIDCLTHVHCVREKRDRQYFGHNFDIFRYIVVTFCKEYHEGNAKLVTHSFTM